MNELHYEEFDKLFAYGPASGELINRIDRGKRAKKGLTALTKNRQGRYRVRLGNRSISAERICLLLLFKVDPGDNITFRDGDVLNLKADNLVVGDSAAIERNRAVEPKIMPEPPVQVDGEVTQMKNGKWLARKASGGGIKIVGRFETEAMALEALKC